MTPFGPLITSPSSSKPSEASKRLLPWLVAVAFFMESLDTTILKYGGSHYLCGSGCRCSQHEGSAGKLHAEPCGLHSHQWLDGGPVWNASRICIGDRAIHARFVFMRNIGEYSSARGMPHPAGLRGAMMVPVGRLTLVRTFAKSELLRTMSFVSIPALVAPMLGPIAGGLIVGYLQWRFIFFLNIPIGLAGLILVYIHLPDYREEDTHPLDIVGLILFGSGIGLLSYVLEIFGEHTLSAREMCGLLALSLALLAGYGIHASSLAFPLLDLKLFSIRTFRAAVSGSFFTRLGIGGVPFLLPLLYQVGLGFTPIQSGLLVMPQAIAAMTMKTIMPRLLRSVGYRGVLISNTVILGVLLMVFATIGLRTPVWAIVLLAFLYGAFTSLQYTSMNTLVYADITEKDTSSASSIASTMQQMSISFGVATAGLATAFFVSSTHSDPAQMISGIHKALIALGILTVVSTIVFRSLKSGDGDDVSQHKVLHPGG
jgi:MFS family permease